MTDLSGFLWSWAVSAAGHTHGETLAFTFGRFARELREYSLVSDNVHTKLSGARLYRQIRHLAAALKKLPGSEKRGGGSTLRLKTNKQQRGESSDSAPRFLTYSCWHLASQPPFPQSPHYDGDERPFVCGTPTKHKNATIICEHRITPEPPHERIQRFFLLLVENSSEWKLFIRLRSEDFLCCPWNVNLQLQTDRHRQKDKQRQTDRGKRTDKR